jgi:hypothetical protein
MSDSRQSQSAVLDPTRVTVDDLFRDLAGSESGAVAERLQRMATDVMLSEGAGTLMDAAAFIRVITREHGVPGSDATRHMERLAEELTEQAAVWQQASDDAAISIRAANKRNRTQA